MSMIERFPNGIESVLVGLSEGVDAEELISTTMALINKCLGVAVIDATAGQSEELGIQTKRPHPSEAIDLLASSVYNMIEGPVSAKLLDVWAELRGNRQVVDELSFTTGPVAHYCQRLNSDRRYMICLSVPTGTNPNATIQQLARICGRAVLVK